MKYSIAQAAHHSGLSVDTLRNYERIAELQACLDVLDHKIDSYERIERNMIAESPDAARVDATPTEKEVSA